MLAGFHTWYDTLNGEYHASVEEAWEAATERALRAIEIIKNHVIWNHSSHTMMEKYLNDAMKSIQEDEDV